MLKRNKICFYELECYKRATEAQRNEHRINGNRCYDLEIAPTQMYKLFVAFILDRGTYITLSALHYDPSYYYHVLMYIEDRQLEEIEYQRETDIIADFKKWLCIHNCSPIGTYRYVPNKSDLGVIEFIKELITFARKFDDRSEKEKNIWELNNMGFPVRQNPINNIGSINFEPISQQEARKEVKEVAFMHLKYEAVSTVAGELVAVKRFSRFLKERFSSIQSLQEVNRDIIEAYLMYLYTETEGVKSYRSDLQALKRVLEDIGNIYERRHMRRLFINNDFHSQPRCVFKFYTESELKRLNELFLKMDEQIARLLLLHQLLGTRISDTLTLKRDCLSIRDNVFFIRIDQVKSVIFEKPVSDEVARLIIKAIEYTEEHYGATEYIFVNSEDPGRPYTYAALYTRVKKKIKKENILDDNGELIKFNTHTFRRNYGKKLTEMHVEDWMIAKLLGHQTLQTVNRYRRMSPKVLADETREVRKKMDEILREIIKEWDGYDLESIESEI